MDYEQKKLENKSREHKFSCLEMAEEILNLEKWVRDLLDEKQKRELKILDLKGDIGDLEREIVDLREKYEQKSS